MSRVEQKSGLGKDGPSWLKEDHGTTTCELRSRSRWLSPSDQQATLVSFLLLAVCISIIYIIVLFLNADQLQACKVQ